MLAGQGFRTYLIDTARVPIDTIYAGRAVRERRLISIEQLKAQPEDPFFATLFAEENFVSYYGVPLFTKGKVEGRIGSVPSSRLCILTRSGLIF